jgi:hypothetical protein
MASCACASIAQPTGRPSGYVNPKDSLCVIDDQSEVSSIGAENLIKATLSEHVRLLDRENTAISIKRSRHQKQHDRRLRLFNQLEDEVDLGNEMPSKGILSSLRPTGRHQLTVLPNRKVESKRFLL